VDVEISLCCGNMIDTPAWQWCNGSGVDRSVSAHLFLLISSLHERPSSMLKNSCVDDVICIEFKCFTCSITEI
jgi:hypothetical protein